MEFVKTLWKNLSELSSVNRNASTFILSGILSFPNNQRYQIRFNVFLRCLSQPKNPIGNILILQGGIRHMNNNSYYVRTACACSSSNVRIFLYENLYPMVNYEFAHGVEDCVKFIRNNFPEPITIIGYSMGGILLYAYLSFGYDSADLYIPTCCPLDLKNFKEIVDDHCVFKIIQKKAYSRFCVEGYEELLEMSGTNVEEYHRFIENFIPGLNKYLSKWVHKTIYIVSSDDPISKNYENELKLLKKSPMVYCVKNGWHCCLNSIYLSTQLTREYFQKVKEIRRKNKKDGKNRKVDIKTLCIK